MTHPCQPRSRWRRLLLALTPWRRRTACACQLLTTRTPTITGTGEQQDPYVVHP